MEQDRIIGYIGLWAIVGNSVSAILVSRMVDSIRGRMKLTLLVLMSLGIMCWIWLGLLCLGVIPFSLSKYQTQQDMMDEKGEKLERAHCVSVQLYVSTIAASALTYSTGPIFFEFTVELVYPVPEGIVGGFLTTVYNSIGMIFLFLFYVPQIGNEAKSLARSID